MTRDKTGTWVFVS